MVPLSETASEVFFSAMTTFLSGSYDALEETLTHMNSIKLNIYPGEKVTYCCAEILVDSKRLECSGYLKPEHLGYTTCIFEDNSKSRFHLWAIQKYKEVTEFINKIRVCDIYIISQEEIITYKSLVQ